MGILLINVTLNFLDAYASDTIVCLLKFPKAVHQSTPSFNYLFVG